MRPRDRGVGLLVFGIPTTAVAAVLLALVVETGGSGDFRAALAVALFVGFLAVCVGARLVFGPSQNHPDGS